jgi:hypothetical protein
MSISFYALRSAEDQKPIDFRSNDRPHFNNGNAIAVLRALGLVSEDDDLWASKLIPIADFRRACMRGRSDARAHREEREHYEDGRLWIAGLDSEAILQRIDRLAEWAAAMTDKGGALVYWG